MEIYELLWERMSLSILNALREIKKYEHGVKLCRFISKYQFRIDAEELGEVILSKE